MKKILLSVSVGLLSPNFLSAQTTQIDLSNTREGESVEYCISHKKEAELMLNPEAVASFAQDKLLRLQESESMSSISKATVLYIPVVFHVLHNNGIENISDEQILNAMEILNRDYRKLNVDANNVHSDFQGMPADMDIEFRLATKAPDGTCFNGITRTVNAISNNGSDGNAQVTAIINGNDVYQGQWPGNRYMNIFVCGEIGGAAGYTYTPNNWIGSSMYNGIWVLHNYVGSIGTSSIYSSRTLTHEAGHWLNLSHPWGSNNNPGDPASCSTDDGVDDTPNTIGVTSCNLNENTCGPRANVENYMDYSYCSKMFTQGQVNRARNALQSSIGGRNNLITQSNHSYTGIFDVVLCKADFSAQRTLLCQGDQLTFNDESYNAASGWTWTFEGGTPSSSTTQNPTVTYNTPGNYAVTLTATDGTTSDTETRTGYITVLSGSGGLPFFEGFENYNSLDDSGWRIDNPNGPGFELYTGTGHTGNKCVKLNNFGEPSDRNDELLAPIVDLSGVGSTAPLTLSFRYSYKRKNTASDEWLKLFVTNNCGESWSQRKTLHGTSLSSDVFSAAWTPSSQEDWTTVHVTNITGTYRVENFRYKFKFESDAGNNIYLDNINIYEGTPSEEVVLSVANNGELVSDLLTFPNPTENELNVRFNIEQSNAVSISVKNLAGQQLQSTTVNANSGSNLVLMDVNKLSQGMYFLELRIGDGTQTVQFLVK